MSIRTGATLLLGAVALAGCGSGGGVDLSTVGNDAGPGLGEASPPSISFSGWKTDVKRHTVPLSQFVPGGPGKDGIPALDRPRFAPARSVGFLQSHEPLIELTVRGQTRGYPLEILIWHEIVNDRIAGVPVTVTFCPLCNTSIAFDRRVGGRTLDFGTTGNLRNSDLVMYDRQTESWWQQFGGAGLVGHYAGTVLRRLPARIVSWQDFRARHPSARVLTRDTGYNRPYGQNPYPGYDDVSSPPYFATRNADDRRLPPKERVVFLERAGESVAVPESLLARKRVVPVEVGGHRLVVRAAGKAASALDRVGIAAGRDLVTAQVTEDGRPVPFEEPFWFAVAAFRPHTRVIR